MFEQDKWNKGWSEPNLFGRKPKRDRLSIRFMAALLVACLAWIYVTRVWSDPLYADLADAYYAGRDTAQFEQNGTVDVASAVHRHIPLGTDAGAARAKLEQTGFAVTARKTDGHARVELLATFQPTLVAGLAHTVVLQLKDGRVVAIRTRSQASAL
jgi:hypothetical protein